MNLHFIAVGGSIMHNLAISLRRNGHNVTGSDDEIFEPARSALAADGLLPNEEGWFPDKIHDGLHAVILGMHAKPDNPELLRAKELGLHIYSFPTFVADQVQNKKRIVVGGSHGKTTITSMLMHVLKECGKDFDYLVGSKVEGFDLTVKLTDSAPIVVIEGDEYLSSAIERVPKFHLYKPDIALITGIAWDHINVFPTFENYVAQFALFVDTIEKNGKLIYNLEDPMLRQIAVYSNPDITKLPYHVPDHVIRDGKSYLKHKGNEYPVSVIGKHNLENIEGARNVCNQIGIKDDAFYKAIASFKGAARRMELLYESASTLVYRDFAHSPSKLKATTQAVKEQYADKKLVAVMELHTYSSLNKKFLGEYKDAMNAADEAVVYFDSHTLAIKKLEPISAAEVSQAFGRKDIRVYTESVDLEAFLMERNWKNTNLLLMSSGNFGGLDLKGLVNTAIAKDQL